MIVIRKAERRDLPSLGRLGVMLMREHHEFDRDRFLAPLKESEARYGAFLGAVAAEPESCVFVAEDDGAIAGYVYAALEPLSWVQLRGPAGFIHDIAVDEARRHVGIGTKLMQAAIDWLREHQAPRVILWTATPNEPAKALFRKLGFRDTMTEMTKELGG